MEKAARAFRGEDSLRSERITRDAIEPFLAARGFGDIKDERHRTGTATEQFVSATLPDGRRIKMRVRVCWRREGRNPSERKYSAAQLRARLRGDARTMR